MARSDLCKSIGILGFLDAFLKENTIPHPWKLAFLKKVWMFSFISISNRVSMGNFPWILMESTPKIMEFGCGNFRFSSSNRGNFIHSAGPEDPSIHIFLGKSPFQALHTPGFFGFPLLFSGGSGSAPALHQFGINFPQNSLSPLFSTIGRFSFHGYATRKSIDLEGIFEFEFWPPKY